MVIILASTFALLLTCFLAKSYGDNSSQLVERRSTLVTAGIQIICGDCSGEEELPKKTYLDRSGNCSQCGGHSHILAANRLIYAQQLIATRLSQCGADADKSPAAVVHKETEPQWSLISVAMLA
jgi:hypothetical protein